jgi:hypothetical protein
MNDAAGVGQLDFAVGPFTALSPSQQSIFSIHQYSINEAVAFLPDGNHYRIVFICTIR